MDRGFYFEETEGLFSKMATRRGTEDSGPLDRRWTAWIRTERGIGEQMAGTVADGGNSSPALQFVIGEKGENAYGLN